MSLSPSGIVSIVRSQLYDSSQSFWSDTDIYNYLTQAQNIVASVTSSLKTSSVVSGVAGQRTYLRPSNAIDIYRITWNNYPLTKIDINEIDRIEGTSYNFVASSGNCEYYYEDGNSIGLSPVPNESKDILVYYSFVPTPLTASSTTFSIPDEYVYDLIEYALYRAYSKDDNDGRAMNYKRLWDMNLEKITRSVSRRNRSNDKFVVKDSSSYTIL